VVFVLNGVKIREQWQVLVLKVLIVREQFAIFSFESGQYTNTKIDFWFWNIENCTMTIFDFSVCNIDFCILKN
jgi:hypothetical protein